MSLNLNLVPPHCVVSVNDLVYFNSIMILRISNLNVSHKQNQFFYIAYHTCVLGWICKFVII